MLKSAYSKDKYVQRRQDQLDRNLLTSMDHIITFLIDSKTWSMLILDRSSDLIKYFRPSNVNLSSAQMQYTYSIMQSLECCLIMFQPQALQSYYGLLWITICKPTYKDINSSHRYIISQDMRRLIIKVLLISDASNLRISLVIRQQVLVHPKNNLQISPSS